MQDNLLLGIIEVSASIAVVGAFIFAIKSYISFRNAEELKLAESIFKDLRDLEKKKYELPIEPTEKEQLKDWASLFFNTLEWFSFLVNKNKIKDRETVNFFKDAVIDWYDNIFLDSMYIEIWQVKKDNEYPELKKLYKDMKKGKYDKKYFDPNEI